VRLVAMLALMVTFAMLGCSDDETTVNVNVGALRVTDANAAMMGGEDFTFPNGVGAFGTTGTSTTVAFNDDATEADITAGDFSASAGAEYGSCIFTIGESEFGPTHPLAPSAIIRIQRCTLSVAAVDVPEGGDPVDGAAILTLGPFTSEEVEVEVQLGEDDSLFVNGVDTGIDVTGSEGDTND
jgi:hypothetical protein